MVVQNSVLCKATRCIRQVNLGLSSISILNGMKHLASYPGNSGGLAKSRATLTRIPRFTPSCVRGEIAATNGG